MTKTPLLITAGAILGAALTLTLALAPVPTDEPTPRPEASHTLEPTIGEPAFPDPLPLDPIPEEPVYEGITPTIPAPEVIMEDDPRWDCRTMGNFTCGVEIQGVWYNLDFSTGTFSPRP